MGCDTIVCEWCVMGQDLPGKHVMGVGCKDFVAWDEMKTTSDGWMYVYAATSQVQLLKEMVRAREHDAHAKEIEVTKLKRRLQTQAHEAPSPRPPVISGSSRKSKASVKGGGDTLPKIVDGATKASVKGGGDTLPRIVERATTIVTAAAG